jgi:2-iminobutanoate/2-iminopropanoate deaminase
MALQRPRRPRIRSGRSLRSLGSPLNARPLGDTIGPVDTTGRLDSRSITITRDFTEGISMRVIALFSVLVALAALAPTAATQRQFINPPGLHPQGLPFNDAVQTGNTLYLSGNIGLNPMTGKVAAEFSEEARQALKNLGAVLKAAGFGYRDVVKVNVFLADMARFDDWNKVYQEFFSGDFPARSTVGVTGLALGAKLEVEMIAVKTGPGVKRLTQ